jgi:hypothetical protein
MSRDPACVYRAASITEADLVVAWLQEGGIPAVGKDIAAATLYGSLAVAPGGIGVCVVDSRDADRARALLEQRRNELNQGRRSSACGTIRATCEECGQSADFPADQRGTVQTCPYCREYVDVPL